MNGMDKINKIFANIEIRFLDMNIKLADQFNIPERKKIIKDTKRDLKKIEGYLKNVKNKKDKESIKQGIDKFRKTTLKTFEEQVKKLEKDLDKIPKIAKNI